MMQFGFRLEANADYMTMIGGNGPTIRTIWLNKKTHTEDRLLFPIYGGEGIAHWESDTTSIFGRRAFTGEIPYCDRPVDNDSLDLTPPTGGFAPPGADK